MKQLVLVPEAKTELFKAARWYEQRKKGLGGEFRTAIEEAFAGIQQSPERGLPLGKTAFRYRLIKRFPYVVYYRERDDLIWVIAVAHGRRRPEYWKHRRLR